MTTPERICPGRGSWNSSLVRRSFMDFAVAFIRITSPLHRALATLETGNHYTTIDWGKSSIQAIDLAKASAMMVRHF
jgi:hypothetical protein